MIQPNLSNKERLARLCIGLALAGWLMTRPTLTTLHWLALAASIALLLNALSSRCYLWSALRISTRQDPLCPASLPGRRHPAE